MLFPEKKYLVISAVGDESLHRHWCQSKNYDTLLIYYGDGVGYKHHSKYYKEAKGPKFHLIKQALEEIPELQYYTYIWMPDDDVYLDSKEVFRLFEINTEFNLSISQPSIMGWYGPTAPLAEAGTLLRYTNWVEIMCPCMSRKALKVCLPTFDENKTGWSIDAAWNVLLGHPKNEMAIIDDVVAFHTRPVFGGDIYNEFGEEALTKAWRDSEIVRDKYNLVEETDKDIGTKIGQGEIYGAVKYSEVQKKMEGGLPRNERFWPPIPALQKFIEELRKPTSYV